MPVNVKLLRKVMNFIERHPEKHDQGTWFCRTTKCFAGWACHFEGYHPLTKYEQNAFDEAEYEEVPIVGDTVVVNGETMGQVDEVAQQLLGLTNEQANSLFYHQYGRNSLLAKVQSLIEEAQRGEQA